MEVPVIDRAPFEMVFGVRRRRAIQPAALLRRLPGWTFRIDRLALIGQLGSFLSGTEFTMQERRRQRLCEALEKGRLHGAAARVRIPVKPDVQDRRMSDLPGGIQLRPGSLRVEFCKVEDLLAKLFELSKAAGNDFEAFRRAAEGQ